MAVGIKRVDGYFSIRRLLNGTVGIQVYGGIENQTTIYVAVRAYVRATTSQSQPQGRFTSYNHFFVIIFQKYNRILSNKIEIENTLSIKTNTNRINTIPELLLNIFPINGA